MVYICLKVCIFYLEIKFYLIFKGDFIMIKRKLSDVNSILMYKQLLEKPEKESKTATA